MAPGWQPTATPKKPKVTECLRFIILSHSPGSEPEVYAKEAKGEGVFPFYHPPTHPGLEPGYTEVKKKKQAFLPIKKMKKFFSFFPADVWNGPINVLRVETSRWPYSVHIASP